MKRLTAQGQLKNGDEIIIVGKSPKDDQRAIVKLVFDNEGSEEIIIDRTKNRYFITSMVVSGDSWAQQVLISNSY